jgi:hypothetical protein
MELWGYLMWGLAGLAVAIPELAAAYGHAPWPTISATVGHLETAHSWVRLVVVFVIVVAAYYSLGQVRPPRADGLAALARTAGGRAVATTRPVEIVMTSGFLLVAAAGFVAGLIVACVEGRTHPGSFTGAYVLYGLIALLWFLVPSVLAFALGRDVPFPTLLRTIGNLEHRAPPLAAIIVAGLTILLLHLAFYPWPSMTGVPHLPIQHIA